MEGLLRFMSERNICAVHSTFEGSCHSVAEAAASADALPEDFIKSICMIGQDGRLIVAIVKGEDRASTTRVAKALHIGRPRTATPEEVLLKTGYPCGGTPPFGFDATFLIDPGVMEKDLVYGGGGTEHSLVRLSPAELLKANKGMVVRVRK